MGSTSHRGEMIKARRQKSHLTLKLGIKGTREEYNSAVFSTTETKSACFCMFRAKIQSLEPMC